MEFPKVAGPGPETSDHVVEVALDAVPERFAVMPVWAAGAVPGSTVGAKLWLNRMLRRGRKVSVA